MINNPNDLKWMSGPLPDVRSVPYNCQILVWISYRGDHTVLRVYPHIDDHNPLMWLDHEGYPLIYKERITHWAWLEHGSEKVKDWKETGF